MSFDVMIPARLNSSRLPRKMLLDLGGKTVIQRTYEACQKSKAENIYILTDSQEIYEAAKQFTHNVIYTSEACATGTERIIEAIEILQIPERRIIVNVQGDEPFIPASLIDQVWHSLEEHVETPMATLATPIHAMDDFNNPNVVKVIRDVYDHALYFTRSPVPYFREVYPLEKLALRHIGIYGYRSDFLRILANLPVSPLQSVESLEQLQVLWHGYKIYVGITTEALVGDLNTPEDYARLKQVDL